MLQQKLWADIYNANQGLKIILDNKQRAAAIFPQT
jgi:hypothetical protein